MIMKIRFYGFRAFLGQGIRSAKRLIVQKASRVVSLLHNNPLKVCLFSTYKSSNNSMAEILG